MSEFGHFGRSGGGMCIDYWGAGPFVMVVGGKSYRFEDSDRFGPTLIGKHGDPLEKQPGERSPFWRGYNAWRRQNRSMEADGVTCVWREPKPTTIMRLHGRHSVIIEDGEEGGATIVLPFDPATCPIGRKTEPEVSS